MRNTAPIREPERTEVPRLNLYEVRLQSGVVHKIEADDWDEAVRVVVADYKNHGVVQLTERQYIEVGFMSTSISTSYEGPV